MLSVSVASHPLLDIGAFVARLPAPLAQIAKSDAIAPERPAPLSSDDTVRSAVRALLRHGGFKPSGRSKPASEYLVGAFAEGRFPSINAAVDACNVVSLHSGLPISLVDVGKLEGALTAGVLPMGTTYVFNPSGQVIDAGGLLCLSDAVGPSGTPVKDAQRTKTDDATCDTLAIVWGTHALPERTAITTRWYRELLATIPGVVLEDVALQ
jgi:DNA/RNA-binding domain of Phe-tRNA-synthetase-like protein